MLKNMHPPGASNEKGDARNSVAPNSKTITNEPTNNAAEATVQDGLDIEALNEFCRMGFGLRLLSPSLDPRHRDERNSPRLPMAHVLPPLVHIHVNRRANDPYYDGPLLWTDAETGVHGEGAVALVAHVLGVPIDEAARRLARFAAIASKAHSEAKVVAMFSKRAERQAA